MSEFLEKLVKETMITVIILLIIGGAIFVFFREDIKNFTESSDELTDFQLKVHFQKYENAISNDERLNLVSELCDTHVTNEGKVKCITEFYLRHYNYTSNNDTFRTTTEFIESGGVCRDIAINVCACSEKINISCSYIFPDNHVFPMLEFYDNGQKYYCTVDGEVECKKFLNTDNFTVSEDENIEFRYKMYKDAYLTLSTQYDNLMNDYQTVGTMYNELVNKYTNQDEVINNLIFEKYNKTTDYTFSGCSSHSRTIKVCKDCDYWISCDSESMMPTFGCEHELSLCKPKKDEVRVGDIIWFSSSVSDYDVGTKYVTHRVIEITPEGYLTQGDNNHYIDNWVVPFDMILGKVYSIESP